MSQKLCGKHVLVIGGTSGIGLGVAGAALGDGAIVTVASATQSRVDAAVSQLRASVDDSAGPTPNVQGFTCDLASSNPESKIEELFSTAEKVAPIDHVILTAIRQLAIVPIQEIEPQTIVEAAHMGMVAPIIIAKVAARHLSSKNTSSITFTSGTVCVRPVPEWNVPSFLCGGIQSVARNLAIDIAPIRVNVVRCGLVRTDLWRFVPESDREVMYTGVGGKLPVGRVGTPDDVAEAYLWLMKDKFVTGTIANTDGGGIIS